MQNGNLTLVQGDATEPQTTTPHEICIIPHVCNDLGGWGAGFVVALSKKFGESQSVPISIICLVKKACQYWVKPVLLKWVTSLLLLI